MCVCDRRNMQTVVSIKWRHNASHSVIDTNIHPNKQFRPGAPNHAHANQNFSKCTLLVALVFEGDGSINDDADVTEVGAAHMNVAI